MISPKIYYDDHWFSKYFSACRKYMTEEIKDAIQGKKTKEIENSSLPKLDFRWPVIATVITSIACIILTKSFLITFSSLFASAIILTGGSVITLIAISTLKDLLSVGIPNKFFKDAGET